MLKVLILCMIVTIFNVSAARDTEDSFVPAKDYATGTYRRSTGIQGKTKQIYAKNSASGAQKEQRMPRMCNILKIGAFRPILLKASR